MNRRYLFGGLVLAAVAAALAALFARSHFGPTGAGSRVAAPSVVDLRSLRARAEGGQARAQVQLGGLYAKGESVTNSYAEAAKWYERAAAQGDAEAELALGELFEAGQGVPKDVAHALELYRKAAEQGYAGAQYTLGFMYEAGRGLTVDHAEASRWFRRAAEGGDPLAQFDLGQRYDLGVGVPVDRIAAYKWLALAAAQGQADSVPRLKQVEAKMTSAEIKEARRLVAEFSPAKSASH